MKKILVTLLCVLTLCGCGDKGKHFDKTEGGKIEHDHYYVEKVTKDGDAIARWEKYGWKNGERSGMVLFLRQDGVSYYDGQIIDMANGEYLVTIGTYTFKESDEYVLRSTGKEVMIKRTIPIVARRKHRP